MDFTFPITALVGANGTNKSSLLRALYGCPGSNNLGNYWFSTDTDPIIEGDSFPNCFIYGYARNAQGDVAEVLKTRIKKEDDPDYWEPSRPILRYGMEKMPEAEAADPFRLATRWRTMEKEVIFIDFRHSLSAFDKYFYFGDFARTSTFKTKKDFIRGRALHLGRAVASLANSYVYYIDRVIGKFNVKLDDAVVHEISEILGRTYAEIRLINHSFFGQDGFTARIVQSNLKYTEAFAGSGEFAVIMLVSKIMAASDRSLILLDEPEVSLHPGAQTRLLNFLSGQVKVKKHQIVFTTHSPSMLRGLPPDAIKVFGTESTTGKVALLAQEALPEEAFLQIGEPIPGLKTVIVEDRLAAEIVKRALRLHEPALLQLVELRFFPGGASVLFDNFLPVYSSEDRTDVICILDGDQRQLEALYDDEQIRVLSDGQLGEAVKSTTGVDIKFPIDSGSSSEKNAQTAAIRRKFLRWCNRYLKYLPGESPEQLVLERIGVQNVSAPKDKFRDLTHESLGLLPVESPTSEDIFSFQKAAVGKIGTSDASLRQLAETIKTFMAGD